MLSESFDVGATSFVAVRVALCGASISWQSRCGELDGYVLHEKIRLAALYTT